MLTYAAVNTFSGYFQNFSHLGCLDGPLTLGVCFARLELAANLVYARCNARAEVAELADAHGSGPCTRKGVEVQVLSSAPKP